MNLEINLRKSRFATQISGSPVELGDNVVKFLARRDALDKIVDFIERRGDSGELRGDKP